MEFGLQYYKDLVKQVRTPPVRPADGAVGCVYESFVPGGELLWFGAAGEDKVCGARSRSVKCIALLGSKRPRQSAMDFNGIRRLYLPLRPKARFSPGRKTPPSVSAPSTGLRPLNVSRVKCGDRPCRGHAVLPCTGVTICLKCAFLYNCGRFDFSLPETRSGRDRVLPI